ncbi:hypothetical protein Hsar01_01631 [Haloferula sargassicola]|uniref:DUF11 domain-containing protein n=2 Tax=Haloferula sargassicola TaxID=490096 RepID=A0ABP9ULC6_9BACT
MRVWLSFDGAFAYVATWNDGKVVRVDLDAWSVHSSFGVGSELIGLTSYPYTANDLIVLDGPGERLAVNRGGSYGYGGIALVVDGAIQGTPLLQDESSYSLGLGVLARTGDPDRILFHSEQGGILGLQVGAEGFTILDSAYKPFFRDLEGNHAPLRLQSLGDLVLCSNGIIGDASSLEVVTALPPSDTTCPDTDRGAAFSIDAYRSLYGDPDRIRMTFLDSMLEGPSWVLPGPSTTCADLMRWGTSGLVFRALNANGFPSSIRLVSLDGLPDPAGPGSDLEVHVTAPIVIANAGEAVPVSVTISNPGAVDVAQVAVRLDCIGVTSVLGLEGDGSYSFDGSQIELDSFDLEAGDSRTFEISLEAGDPGIFGCEAVVWCATTEDNTSNNVDSTFACIGYRRQEGVMDVLAFPTEAFAYDATRNLLWIAPEAEAGSLLANRVFPLDLANGEIHDPLEVSGLPQTIALSSDDRYLYLGFADRSEIARFDLSGAEEVPLIIPLSGGGFSSAVRASRIQVLEGDGRSVIAVLWTGSTQQAGMVVYDDATRRPDVVQDSRLFPEIQASGSPDLFFGLNNRDTGFELGQLHVDPSGIRIGDVVPKLLGYHFYQSVRSLGDRVFGGAGMVANGRSLEVEGELFVDGMMFLHPESRQVGFVVFGDSNRFDQLLTFDMDSFRLRSVVGLGNGPSSRGPTTECGDHGFAMAGDGLLYLWSDSHVLPAGDPADVVITVEPGAESIGIGEELGHTIVVENRGESVAEDVWVAVSVSENQNLPFFDPAPVIEQDGFNYFYVGDLPGGGVADIALTSSVAEPGSATTTAVLLSRSPLANADSATSIIPVGFGSEPGFYHEIPIPTVDLLHDPSRDLIWASVSPFGPPGLERTVVAIDPATGRITTVLPQVSAPGKLALSSDGSSLLVAALDAPKFWRMDVTDGSADESVYLGVDQYAGDLEALPDGPGSVLVLKENRSTSIPFVGLAAYDGLSKRPVELGLQLQDGRIDDIEPTSVQTEFHGIEFRSIPGAFSRLRVDGTGVTRIDEVHVDERLGRFSHGVGEYLVNSGGVVISGQPLVWETLFPKTDYLRADLTIDYDHFAPQGPCLAGPNIDRVWFLETATFGNRQRVAAYSATSGCFLSSVDLPGTDPSCDGFILAGDHGFAFRGESGIALSDGGMTMPTSSSCDLRLGLSPSMATATIGEWCELTVSVENQGPDDLDGARIGLRVEGAEVISPEKLRHLRNYGFEVVEMDVGAMAAGESREFQIRVEPSIVGSMVIKGSVTPECGDPDYSNNQQVLKVPAGFVSVADGFADRKILARDIVEDRSRGWVWACVPPESRPPLPAKVVGIDPVTGLDRQEIEMEGTPDVMAISRNGHYLYVGRKDSSVIERLDLTGQGFDVRIPLEEVDGDIRASDIHVLEGDGTSIIVVLVNSATSSSAAGVAVFDGTRKRDQVALDFQIENYLTGSDDPTLFYAQGQYDLMHLRVEPSGVVVERKQSQSNFLGWPKRDSFAVKNGHLFSSNGKVLSLSDMSLSADFPLFGGGGKWLLGSGGEMDEINGTTIRRIDSGSLASLRSRTLLPTPLGTLTRAVRTLDDGYALLFNTQLGVGETGLVRFARWTGASREEHPVVSPLDPLVETPGGDYDHDGLSDGFEYYFATPAGSVSANPIRIDTNAVAEERVVCRFERRFGLPPGLCRLVYSENLNDWIELDELSETVVGTRMVDGIPVGEVEVQLPASESRGGYIRFEWLGDR